MKRDRLFRKESPAEELRIPTELPPQFARTAPSGLTAEEVRRRQAEGRDNRPAKNEGKSVLQILAGNLFTLFNLLNVGLALALAAVGAWRNMLFLGVVISNTVIGTVQELRARRTIRRLTLLSAAPVRVMRDGQAGERPVADLVEGDVVILRTGDQIPADAVVLSGTAEANEALLTGESNPLQKREGDWLLSGSYLVSGRVCAQLVYVGEASYARRMTKAAKAIRPPASELMRSLNRLVRILTAILLPLGAALFCRQTFLRHGALENTIPQTVAAMIGMIPEGLILLTSMALMVGVIRLGRKGTLVNGLYGIENLARVDMLCLDKTGTLTSGRMQVSGLHPTEGVTEERLRAALGRYMGAFEAESPTLRALAEAFPPTGAKPEAVLPFSSERKRSAAAFADGETLTLGAPSFVLGAAYAGAVREWCEQLAAQGHRVLALCATHGGLSEAEHPENRALLGLVTLEDELRPHVCDTLTWFAAQGVSLKVISGDDPRTVSVIAARAGLAGAEKWLDAAALSPEELAAQAESYTVFGRVSPAGKQALIAALRRAGHTVAMTGDGVNDIPAMKTADCAVAMAGGSNAVQHAAQLTLLDADFAVLPAAVAEGRRVINNITRAAALFLTKTGYSFALSLLLLFLPAQYPFQPIQLTLISTLTIGTPSFFLALERNGERVTGQFLQTVLWKALPCAVAVTVSATVAMLLERVWPTDLCATVATLSAGILGLVNLGCVCWPLNWRRAGLVALMAATFAGAVLLFGHIFYLVPLTEKAWAVLLGLIAAGTALLLSGKGLTRALKGKRQKAA